MRYLAATGRRQCVRGSFERRRRGGGGGGGRDRADEEEDEEEEIGRRRRYLAATVSPMSADRLGATVDILASRYEYSCLRYRAREIIRSVKTTMLFMSCSDVSMPIDERAAYKRGGGGGGISGGLLMGVSVVYYLCRCIMKGLGLLMGVLLKEAL